MKVAIGSDHGGFLLKKQIIGHFRKKGIEYKDLGAFSEEAVDYPDFALAVAQEVASGLCRMGIICCGTGIGVAVCANKVPGIRAAVGHDTFSARMAREHNDANILTLGERVTGPGLALDIVGIFLETSFSGDERHRRRLEKIRGIEEKYGCPGS